jgi:hypothetical protein
LWFFGQKQPLFQWICKLTNSRFFKWKCHWWIHKLTRCNCSQKEGVLWKQTTHTPYDVDPGAYVLQIGLTPQTTFHLQNSNCFLLSLIPQWFTDWQTHRHSNSTTHFLSCASTLMQLQKKFFILIHRICTSLTTQAILAISSSQKERRGSDLSPMYCPPSP